MKRFVILNILILAFILVVSLIAEAKNPLRKNTVFSFIVTADMRGFAGPEYQSSKYFLGTCEAIQKFGKGSFMVSPGNIDPPYHVLDTLKKFWGEIISGILWLEITKRKPPEIWHG